VTKESSTQECAKSMLEIFRARNVAPGRVLMASDVSIGLFSKGWSGADYGAAMQYAEDQNWLKDEGGVVRLLQTGFAAIKSGKRLQTDEDKLAGDAA
jgi:hypothetical protein